MKNLQKAWRTIFQVLRSLAPQKQNVMKWGVAQKPQYGIRSIFYCFRQSENKWHSLLHGIITHIYRNTFVLTDTFSGESSVWAFITPICESRRCQTYSFLNPFEASLFLTTPQNTDRSQFVARPLIFVEGYIDDSCLLKFLFQLNFDKIYFYFHQGLNSWLNKLSREPITAQSAMPL